MKAEEEVLDLTIAILCSYNYNAEDTIMAKKVVDLSHRHIGLYTCACAGRASEYIRTCSYLPRTLLQRVNFWEALCNPPHTPSLDPPLHPQT